MGLRDNNLIVRAASDGMLTGTSTYTLDLHSTPLEGLALHVYVPAVTTSDSMFLEVIVRASTASAPATTDARIAGMEGLDAAAGEYVIPFSTNKRSVMFEFVPSGGDSPNFSEVLAWVDKPQHVWHRNVEFT